MIRTVKTVNCSSDLVVSDALMVVCGPVFSRQAEPGRLRSTLRVEVRRKRARQDPARQAPAPCQPLTLGRGSPNQAQVPHLNRLG